MQQVHEEFWRSTLDGAAAEFTVRPGGVKGEITLVIEGSDGKGVGGGGAGEGLEAAVAGRCMLTPERDASACMRRHQASALVPFILTPCWPRVDRAWFQRLKLNYDEPLSNCAFNSNLRRYTMATMLREGVSPSECSKRAAAELGAKRKEAYAIALRLAGKQP